jgi:2-aminoethylphosphonate-pyruvate transaminase
MSSFGAVPFDMENLGIDFMVSSSNKNIEGIPGVSFIIANKQQLEKCKNIKPRSLSLDMYDQYAYIEKNQGGFRFTSPVHCIKALDQAIVELKQEGGISARHKRYLAMHSKLVEGMNSMKFNQLDLNGYQGPIITTFHTPKCKKYNFNQFYNSLKEQKCIIYPGKLAKADSFRVGTIGSMGVEDIDYLLHCVQNSIFWDNSI